VLTTTQRRIKSSKKVKEMIQRKKSSWEKMVKRLLLKKSLN